MHGRFGKLFGISHYKIDHNTDIVYNIIMSIDNGSKRYF